MNFVWEEFSPKENASYGEEQAKGAAHRAVRKLFDRRILEGKNQEKIAESIGKDPAWLSRVIKGPANWTLKTLGALTVALDGDLTIDVRAVEDCRDRALSNYDAYKDSVEDCQINKSMSFPVSYSEDLSQNINEKGLENSDPSLEKSAPLLFAAGFSS